MLGSNVGADPILVMATIIDMLRDWDVVEETTLLDSDVGVAIPNSGHGHHP